MSSKTKPPEEYGLTYASTGELITWKKGMAVSGIHNGRRFNGVVVDWHKYIVKLVDGNKMTWTPISLIDMVEDEETCLIEPGSGRDKMRKSNNRRRK